MKVLGIKCVSSEKFIKKYSTISAEEAKLIVNLIKELTITRLNQVWTTDITYIKTASEGSFYLISFIDQYSKRVVAWDLTNEQKTEQILSVLKKAVETRNPQPGLIIHSDKGSQMRSKKYREYLQEHNFVCSYTSLNHSCDENAAQESFHALLKKECIYQEKLYTFNDAYLTIYNYIENFYNPIRIHSAIYYLSPANFENLAINSPCFDV